MTSPRGDSERGQGEEEEEEEGAGPMAQCPLLTAAELVLVLVTY